MATLAARLDRALKRAGITAYRLAADTRTDHGTLSKTLGGERTRHEHTTLALWAKRLGVRMEWLSTGEGPMVESEDLPQLKDRPEWPRVVADTLAMHPELAAEDIELIGEMYDNPKLWPGDLDAVVVAAYASIQRDHRARVAALRARVK